MAAKSNSKHDRIIDAAVKTFARKGFFNSKVSEIAREAQVADGTIYLYFKNKDDILISLFEEKMDIIIKRVKVELDKLDDPVSRIKCFITLHLNLIEEDRNLAEVIQVELRQSNKFIREYRGSKFFDYLNIISSIIRDGQKSGVFREDVKPGIAKRALFGALDEMALHFVLSKTRKYSLEESAEQMSRIFLDGLLTPEDEG